MVTDPDELNGQVIRRAAELLEAGWQPRSLAEDADGMEVDNASPEAAAYCVVGALWRAADEIAGLDGDAVELMESAAEQVAQSVREDALPGDGPVEIGEWESAPDRTAEEVVEAVRKAV